MKNIKTSLTLILALSVIAGFAACSQNSTPSSASSEVSQKSIVSEEISETSDEKQSSSPVPEKWQDNGIFSNYYEKAYEMMSDLSINEKIGQMLLVACPGSEAASKAKEYSFGGYVLFGRDFEDKTKDDVIRTIRSYQETAKIPMAIAVDEEGGTVTRISWNENLTDHFFESPREIYNNGGLDAIRTDTKDKSQLLRELGINVNLAPVCDICTDPDDFMYDRSLGQSPEITAAFIKTFVDESQKESVSATLKHFPGYGGNDDTHFGIAIDNRTYEHFTENDFIPFSSGIKAGAHLVLVSHNIVKSMDEKNPSSLSPEVHRILREELNFSGIIITDDMSMEGVGAYLEEDYSAVVAAVLAGNDMILVSDYESAANDILNAYNDDIINEDTIDHAVMRILSWKYAKGMIKD